MTHTYTPHPADSGTATAEPAADAPLDFPQLLHRCLGNVTLARRVLSRFEERFEVDLSRLQAGMQDHDSQLVARVAHQLKGASANLSASGLQRIVTEIEDRGRADRLDEIDALMEQLRGEWHRFLEFRTTAKEFISPQ